MISPARSRSLSLVDNLNVFTITHFFFYSRPYCTILSVDFSYKYWLLYCIYLTYSREQHRELIDDGHAHSRGIDIQTLEVVAVYN